MNYSVVFASSAAFISAAMALTVAWYKRRSFAHWAFVAGMSCLAAESGFLAFALGADSLQEISQYIRLQLSASAFLPAAWLCFSLSYSRGNYHSFLQKWRLLLAVAVLFPVILIPFFYHKLFSIELDPASTVYAIRLLPARYILILLVLLSSVVVLMNLERTFRAAVGTMRWRIKFMLLGLAILFVWNASSSLA